MISWVARLYCGHDIGNRQPSAPTSDDNLWCPRCNKAVPVIDVITDVPERDRAGRA